MIVVATIKPQLTFHVDKIRGLKVMLLNIAPTFHAEKLLGKQTMRRYRGFGIIRL